jgi:hypothetical protein
VADHKAQSERRLCGVSDLSRGLHRDFCLRKHHACVVQKHSAGGRQFDALRSSYKKWRTYLILKVPNLATQRGLCCMQLLFRRKLEASRFCNSDKVTKMPEFQISPLPKKHTPKPTK